MHESVENIQLGREKLLELEKQGEYVFHGSDNPNLDLLEPRQAYNHRDGGKEPDGEPAVFASSKADYAIMMALINNKNCPKGFRSSAGTMTDDRGEAQLHLKIRKDALVQLDDNSVGYVYVFDKNSFQPKNNAGVEHISFTTVVPTEKIFVTKSDLPPHVEVFE